MNRKICIALGIIISVFSVSALYFLAGTGSESIEPKSLVDADSGQRLVMGTFANIIAVANNRKTAQQSTEEAFAEIVKVDELMSDYKSD